ncbi:MAG: LysM peptidoglycan-binding domain-containing protein [Tissierella sp.]|uniref:LysM peptidoglycan-binding domain-containing protein n=1 Tax=Tissierella sp. TaxID=41274 RepID=UPI003F955FB3
MELSKRKLKNQKKHKNKIRELTNKERFLITLLAIVILFWVSFKYIIDPQIFEIRTLETQINDYTFKIEENNRMFKSWDSIVEERNSLFLEKQNIEKDFFKSLSQPEIIYVLNNLLLESNIVMEGIRFNKSFTETFNEKEIQRMDISIPFEGDFKSLNETIKNIGKETRKMIISSIDMEKGEKTEIAGNINLGIYSLSGIVDKKEDIIIEITNDNKIDPFIPYKGYVDPNKQIEESEQTSELENPLSEDEKLTGGKTVDKSTYPTYKAVKGDNISFISKRKYGTEKYVDEILSLNGMKRSSILPIGKELKLIEK